MRLFNTQASGKTQKFFLAALISSIVITGLYCYLWVKIIYKNQEVAALRSDVAVLTADKEGLASIKDKITATASVREKLNNYYISKDGVVPFLNMIQNLGKESRLEFKVSSVAIKDEPKTSDVFENVELIIEVKGGWSDVYRFVTLVELLPLRVFVDQVDLEAVPNGKNTSGAIRKWSGRLNVSILKLK